MTIESDKQNATQPNSGLSGLRYLSELAVGILLFCITLHTFFLAGLIVPVTVSGGSMAKTILGPRTEVYCPNCNIQVSCGHERLPTNGMAYCLNCGQTGIYLNSGKVFPGEHALVDRASLVLNPPHHWEVIVFRCPDNPGQFCIKRVVGLPGEEIELIDGDVYVNGEIARKTLEQCREVAQLVHDRSHSYSDLRPEAVHPRWKKRDQGGCWYLLMSDTRFDTEDTVQKDPSEKIQWIDFHPYRNQPVTDDYDYNQSESRRLNHVPDLMLRFSMNWDDADEFYIQSAVGGETFELTISEVEHQIRLKRDGKVVATGVLPSTQDHFHRWEVVHFDRQLFVTFDSRSIISYSYPLGPSPSAKETDFQAPWSIGVRTGSMELAELQVLRDIYYTVPQASRYAWGVGESVTLADDEFFVLGDNSPISADSRIWKRPGISRKSLVGRLLGTW